MIISPQRRFDPIERYEPVMVNVGIGLAHALGIVLKLTNQISARWDTLALCICFSIILMGFITHLYRRGREHWPHWDKQFALIPGSAFVAQIIMWWLVTPEIPEAIAMTWFGMLMPLSGRLSLAQTLSYSAILVIAFLLIIYRTHSLENQLSDINFLLSFMGLSIHMAITSYFEAQRDTINMANQANLISSQQTLATAYAELERISDHDPLTGLLNRRGFDKRMQNRSTNLVILLIDIDDFKSYNDYFGHPQGDSCLQHISILLHQYTPSDAVLSRHGGEEFLIALPNRTLTEGLDVARIICCAVEAESITHPHARAARVVTVSIGVTCSDDINKPMHILIKTADLALYQAKQYGRNGYRALELNK